MKPPIIIIPIQNPWNWQCDYERQTAERVSRHAYVLLINSAVSHDHKPWFVHIKKHIWMVSVGTILLWFPRRLSFLHDKWLLFVIWSVVFMMRVRYRLSSPLLWFFPMQHERTLFLLRFRWRAIYDCVDQMSFYDTQTTARLSAIEKKIMKKVDLVFVNSLTLHALKKQYHTNIHVVPQGFDCDPFQKTSLARVPKDIVQMKHPIIGYSGGINFRINYFLIQRLAQHHPEWSFIFLGPLIEEDLKQKHIRSTMTIVQSLPNVYFLGNKSRKDIALYLKHIDICIIPYTNEPFNRYCYPMKLFEYFYMGKPVVSTPIEELKRFPSYVRIGSTVKEWEAHIHTFLEKPWPRSYAKKQRQCALKNSWDEKIRIMMHVLVEQKILCAHTISP